MNDPRESSSSNALVVVLVVLVLLLIPCGLAVVFLGGSFLYVSRSAAPVPAPVMKVAPAPVMTMPAVSAEPEVPAPGPDSPPAGEVVEPAELPAGAGNLETPVPAAAPH